MEMVRDTFQIRSLLDLFRNGMLKANPEYQRGAVWSLIQKKKLIDSVMRGYPLPLIYLHHIKKNVAGMQREDLEIIDGQQRINALYEFAEGAYKLLDPRLDEREAKFPTFIRVQECPWGRADIATLSSELREAFLSTELAVVKVTTYTDNEARDLFIRLQAGLPLNSQETRDAWPGQITDFILKIGGKPQLARYPGHLFFKRILGMKPESDRGKTRQLAAQILMLYLNRHRNGADAFVDINSKAIDEFYYSNLDFDSQGEEAQRFVSILDKLENLLAGQKRPPLKGHDAIHLVLLVDSLWDEYTRSWEESLPNALDQFLENLSIGKAHRDDALPNEYWTRYGQWTRVSSDQKDRIRFRHQFYVEKMLRALESLQPKDAKRAYGSLEREIIYFRDKKHCAVCQSEVAWPDSEIHHVVEHQRGGETVLANGVLVHKQCHPKGRAADSFAATRDTD